MYEALARYYDLVHAELTEDIGFVLTLAGRSGGAVLELGCGTGRLLLPLARAGHRVTGVDNSPAMLERAERRVGSESVEVQERISLVSGDMTAFGLQERFGLVVIAYNTLMHLSSAGMTAAIKNASRHLNSGGRLFIDVANPAAVAQTPEDQVLTLERVLQDPESGETVLQLAASRVETMRQELTITWVFDASPPEGGRVRRSVSQMRYHYFHAHELTLSLEAAGLALEGLFGAYNQTPFTEESGRLLAVARRE